VLVSLMIIALISALIGGGIYAVFSDVETSTGNTFTAGTLNLVPATNGAGPVGKYSVTAGGDGINGNVVFDRLAPGDSGSITWTLQNNGNLDGILTMAAILTFEENGSNEPESAVGGNNGGGNGDMDEYVGVRLQRNGTYILGDASNYVPFSGLAAVFNAESRSLAASGTLTYVLEWQIASDVRGAGADGKFGTGDDVQVDDNIIQSDKATFDVTFTLTQA
ncbi:MAG: TasA family protein, partial [Dehalococcoidales bacterium]|nr:TasA family protein [Dehalococcoidales bacterium]